MNYSTPVDAFRLAYDVRAADPAAPARRPVVLLHGWPGDRSDYRLVTPLVDPGSEVVVPDLRGFGDSDRHDVAPDVAPDVGYDAAAQAGSIAGLIEERRLTRPVVAGYDIGSRIAQRLAHDRPDLVGHLVLSPPLPGIGDRVLDPATEPELWHQGFHRSGLAADLLDGRPDQVRTYLRHFWNHWSGPDRRVSEADLEHLVGRYGRPGAFTTSVAWYRNGPGYVANALTERAPGPRDQITVPTEILWQEFDPLFPRAWADRISEFFADARLYHADGVGHFTPVEAPRQFAALLNEAVQRPGASRSSEGGSTNQRP